MAKKIVAGNWKMNLSSQEAFALVDEINAQVDGANCRIVLFPPALFVLPLSRMNKGKYELGVQNFYPKSSGAYTGEISLPQAKSVGAGLALIGHSERREYFQESNAFLREKVDAAVAEGVDFIFCCGEPLEIREAGIQAAFVRQQLEESLFHLPEEALREGIIAYEPIWAIGTGKTATSAQAEAMHRDIRTWLSERYSAALAESVSILYGGSCKPDNAEELFNCPNIDGGLIGGASLKASDFCAIIAAL
jgi:triosephosphate isomerase